MRRLAGSGVVEGRSLLEFGNPFDVVTGAADFADSTGMDLRELITHPIFATPIPRYPRMDWPRESTSIRTGMLWHPFFWLPRRLTTRITDGDATEPDLAWGVRVCAEMMGSGLYSPKEGWLDILAEHGFDIDNPADAAVVSAWQQGEDNSTLDSIDLERWLGSASHDPRWAEKFSDALTMHLIEASRSVMAESLLSELDESLDDEEANIIHDVITNVSLLAPLVIEHVDGEVVDSDIPAVEFWDGINQWCQNIGESPDALLRGPVADARLWLELVRDGYAEFRTDLEHLTDEG